MVNNIVLWEDSDPKSWYGGFLHDNKCNNRKACFKTKQAIYKELEVIEKKYNIKLLII